MSVDERVRSSLNAAADRVDGDPAGVETIRRRAVRRHRTRQAGWATAVVVLVAGFVALSRPLQPSVDLAEALTPSEILADRVVTEEEWEAAGAAVVQCLANQGLEAEFDPGEGSFDVSGDDSESSFEECWGTYMGVSVQRVWADQQYDPVASFEFYRDVVECTESRTGVDYGEMTQDSLGFASTEAHRTINRAIQEAPDVYDSCLDDVAGSPGAP